MKYKIGQQIYSNSFGTGIVKNIEKCQSSVHIVTVDFHNCSYNFVTKDDEIAYLWLNQHSYPLYLEQKRHNYGNHTDFRVGDAVYDYKYGYGTVVQKKSGKRPITVFFPTPEKKLAPVEYTSGKVLKRYFKNGFSNDFCVYPDLFKQ